MINPKRACDGAERAANMAVMVADTPQKRFGQPQAVSALALMLASDDARYVTGSAASPGG